MNTKQRADELENFRKEDLRELYNELNMKARNTPDTTVRLGSGYMIDRIIDMEMEYYPTAFPMTNLHIKGEDAIIEAWKTIRNDVAGKTGYNLDFVGELAAAKMIDDHQTEGTELETFPKNIMKCPQEVRDLYDQAVEANEECGFAATLMIASGSRALITLVQYVNVIKEVEGVRTIR